MVSAVCCPTATSERPRWEVAHVFDRYGEAYRDTHRLCLDHLKVMHAIEVCRRPSLGGHLHRCDQCGFERHAYNSCRNRHCPKCQALTKAKWLEARRAELLPVEYHHAVFTLPHEFNPLALCNKRTVFDILFKAVANTLHQFGADPKRRLAGKIGFTAILHTWDQMLLDHIHLHCVIPGGALSHDRIAWIAAPKGFLFPVRALSVTFRREFLSLIEQAFHAGALQFPGNTSRFATLKEFNLLLGQVRTKPWVVYSKPSFAGPEQVLDYLGRYTHRIAISNHRITHVGDRRVTFTYRHRRTATRKTCTLPVDEFIRRFLLHVLPANYVRIRHFGFLASRAKAKDLQRCRELLGMPPQPEPLPQMSTTELLHHLTGSNITACPLCPHGTMRFVRILPPLYPGSPPRQIPTHEARGSP
jgi:hypothetical protein